MSDNNYNIAYMLDTETGFTYTCFKGEVQSKIKKYPVQKEIMKKEYEDSREPLKEKKELEKELQPINKK